MRENGVWQPTHSIACKGNIVVDIVTDISKGLESQITWQQTNCSQDTLLRHIWQHFHNHSPCTWGELSKRRQDKFYRLHPVHWLSTASLSCLANCVMLCLHFHPSLACSHPCFDICSLCRLLTTHSSCANAYNIYQGSKTAPALHKHKANIQTLLGQYVTVANTT